MVNADPAAALVVGNRLSRETGLPLLMDLRDPWGPCSLRRPLRPWLTRVATDFLERRCVEQATTVILNTETARDDYQQHYADQPADKFVAIRNHASADLISAGSHRGFDRFTMLLLGTLRRFVEGQVLVDTLVELRRRGVSPNDFQLVVQGSRASEIWTQAGQHQVEDYLELEPHVSYLEIGAVLASADLLAIVSHAGQQRVPAKTYDYLTSHRPILAFTENRELAGLLATDRGDGVVGSGDAQGAADFIMACLARGRQQQIARGGHPSTTLAASRRLAQLLERACGSPQLAEAA